MLIETMVQRMILFQSLRIRRTVSVDFLLYGSNIGVQASFMDLIKKADPTFDYYAFSDQDDVWLPEKLSRATQCLQKMPYPETMPCLYCSAKQLVDQI